MHIRMAACEWSGLGINHNGGAMVGAWCVCGALIPVENGRIWVHDEGEDLIERQGFLAELEAKLDRSDEV